MEQVNPFPELDLFVSELIKAKNYQNLPQEMQDEMKSVLREKLDQFLMQKFVAALPYEAVDKLNQLENSQQNPEEAINFFQDNLPNSEKVAAEALGQFKSLFLGE